MDDNKSVMIQCQLHNIDKLSNFGPCKPDILLKVDGDSVELRERKREKEKHILSASRRCMQIFDVEQSLC